MFKPAPLPPGNALKDGSLEKRRSQRHACNLKASWRLLVGGELQPIPATIQDISRHGVALQVPEKCKRGALLSFQIEGVSEQLAGPWLVRVVNVRHQGGTWVIGCSFFKEFADGELDGLLRLRDRPAPARPDALPPRPAAKSVDAPVTQNATERRASPRRAGKRVAIIIAMPNAGGRRCVGRVVDGSTGGLALLMPWALSVGTLVKVRASDAGLAIPWANLRVKHRRRSNHQWIVGCQFIETPPPSILETFC